MATTRASAVHWNRSYDPAHVTRDTEIKAALRAEGVSAESHIGNLLFEPWTIRNGSGDPFRVFTPFWRACLKVLSDVAHPVPAPKRVPPCPDVPKGIDRAGLGLAPRLPWAAGFEPLWQPGEAGAERRLNAFLESRVTDYALGRNRPDEAGTSGLSPHLHFGELSPRQVYAATLAATGESITVKDSGPETFFREVGWREFAHHVLFAFPHTSDAPLDARFAEFEWREDDAALGAWQRGQTGKPPSRFF